MTLLQPLLRKLKAPSLVLASLLLATACATAPARPPVQIGTGEPRVDPVTGEPMPSRGIDDARLNELNPQRPVRGDGGLTPPFMEGRDVKRAAVLLPFSHPNAQVRAEAESMLAGIELALFEYAGDNFLIMPKDTAGKQSVTEARLDESLKEGADIILGPLFGANVKAIKPEASKKQVPVIAFSNDRTAAGGGAYLASISPEEEVTRVMEYAASRGVRTFVFLGPNSEYGKQVEAAMRYQAAQQGGVVASSAFYDPSDGGTSAARQVASVLKAQGGGGKVGVMIPERGVKLLSVAPLLPYNGAPMQNVMLMGTSLWDDSSIWREPTLAGGVYAAPDPSNLAGFKQTYRRIYGRNPTDLAAVAYDAAALSVRLAADDNIRYNGVTDPDGFMGVNGLFRFRIDGTSQRGLAVMQIQSSGPSVVEKGITAFGPGSS
ncbi:penicillin-binding protein activator [Hyphomonas chukchiensis]|uniref:penicillin-binding protein activator n=1 Tax=Hyphomonas chukchiensis TaxID=1280947 RepID=UPI0009DE80CE|nr:penicillin-binding protein activator [Hyphomonas chukchiensis]